MNYLGVKALSHKLIQLKQAYEYCLIQSIEANKKDNFSLESSWDENAQHLLREIETLKNAEVERRKIAQYEKI